MPGVTAIAQTVDGNPASVQLYYNTNNLNLAFQLKSGTSSGDDPSTKFEAKNSAREGFIVNPSTVASSKAWDTNLVVGITFPPQPLQQADFTTYDVSLVSPVYQPLTTTEVGNVSVAMCANDKTAAWVFYLTGADTSNTRIREFRMSNSSTTKFGGATNVLRNSRLAAYYNASAQKDRFVIYQDSENGRLKEYSVNGDSVAPIANSGDSKEGTSIAVAFDGSSAYLFYSDKLGNLRTIKKTGTKWGGSTDIEGAAKVDASSQIAACFSDDQCHIFYVPADDPGSSFTHVRWPDHSKAAAAEPTEEAETS